MGSLAWLLCLQFFVGERLAISYWHGAYTLSGNFVSDLGAGCLPGAVGGCAGWPALMNGCFILQAGLIGAGAVLLGRGAHPLTLRLGFVFAALSAPGLLLVGLFPETVRPTIHYNAAALHFVLLSLSAFCFAFGLFRKARVFAVISLTAALTGTVGTALLGLHIDFGFGFGAVERLVSYPFPLWLVALGFGYATGRIVPSLPNPVQES